jgi:glycerophosphoryl diester phosphodiesterase
MTTFKTNRGPFVLLAIWTLLFLPYTSVSQNITFLPNAYAHNDYWHKRPLLDALDNGFTYVEADVYLRKGQLVVAHMLPALQPSRTLDKLYLHPLSQFFKNDSMGTTNPPITLMIDIKSEPEKTWQALTHLLHRYESLLSYYENGTLYKRAVTIVITGHKPVRTIKSLDCRYVFIDEDLIQMAKEKNPANLFPIASCRYSRIDKQTLCRYVQIAHQNGKIVRLWASPENTMVWKELLSCGVDLINTNKLVELKTFLLNRHTDFARTN